MLTDIHNQLRIADVVVYRLRQENILVSGDGFYMRFSLVFIILFSLILFGCVSQDYYQKVNRDGTSVIRQTTSLPPLSGDLLSALQKECANYGSCTVGNGSITLEKEFSESDGYYAFETKIEFPFNVHVLKVNLIPSERFGEFYSSFAKKYYNDSSLFSSKVVQLSRKSDNIKYAEQLNSSGISVTYTIEMPSDVSRAEAGTYKAQVSGKAATFNLGAVLYDSAPLEVESRELNIALIFAVLVLIVLIAISLQFFMRSRKAKKLFER